VLGICHICGFHKKLSFEHVPPSAAFNHQRILHIAFEKILASENLDDIPGARVQQRGAGAYTLCESCNNNTGHWYASAYAGWAHQAMNIISLVPVGSHHWNTLLTCSPCGS
jgi:5-methylcytosine-specific restriction endonuclease McrA